MTTRLLFSCIAAALLMTGCGGTKNPEQAQEKEATPDIFNVLYQDMHAKLAEDDVDGAIALLENAVADEDYSPNHSGIFATMISILVNSGRIEEAAQRFIKTASDSPAVAENAFRMLDHALQQGEDKEALLTWTTALMEIDFSEAAKGQICTSHAIALIKNGRTEEALALIPKYRESMSPQMCGRVYDGIISSLSSMGMYKLAHQAIDSVEASAGDSQELAGLARTVRMCVLAKEHKWDKFGEKYQEQIADLTPSHASRVLNTAITEMRADNKTQELKLTCGITLEYRKPSERVFSTAARNWITTGAEVDLKGVAAQLQTLLDMNIPSSQIVYLTREPYYASIDKEQLDSLKSMMDILKEVLPSLESENDINAAKSMLVDGAFILNDYDTAIDMIKKKIEGRDESWHRTALAKLKAHRALDKGETEEAVKYFREFMDEVASMKRTRDPSSGMYFTAKWCLGRNAKRIGDIYKKDGKVKEANASYKEAKACFVDALAEFSETSREHTAIQEEMAGLPGSE